MAGVFYLALEPFVRRRWPQALISWTRLLAGSVRDPLVGGHILLGVTLGVALAIVQNGFNWYQFDGAEIAGPNANRIVGLDAARMASFLLSAVIQPAAIVMGALFFVILLRLALRSTVMAAVGVIAVSTLAAWSGGGSGAAVLVSLFTGSLGLWVTLHFGILPGTLMVIFSSVTGTMPLTSDLSAWYAGRGVFVVALTLALATWGFRHALAGRKVLSEAFLDA
jgi:hypothetical protein